MRKKAVLSILAAGAIILGACTPAAQPPTPPPAATPTPAADPAPADPAPADPPGEGEFVPGFHSVTNMGVWDRLTVTLEVSESEILDVIIEHNETEFFVGTAFEELTEAILEAQDPGAVDTVAGATASTSIVLETAAQALALAQGELPAEETPFTAGRYPGVVRPDAHGLGEAMTRVWLTTTDYEITEVEVDYISDTGEEFDEEAAVEALIAAILEAQGPVPDFEIEDAPDATANFRLATTMAVINAERPVAVVTGEGPFAGDGEFISSVFATSVNGRNAPIQIVMGTAPTAITNVSIQHRETSEWVDGPLNYFVEQFIAQQTTDIELSDPDVLSGATVTLTPIIAALEELIEQATE